MNKILLLFISMCISSSFAQSIEETRKFPQDIKDYKKTEESFLEKSKDTTLQLVLFDKTKFDNLLLDNNDLINDAEDLNSKIINYFKLNNEIQTNKNKKIKKSKKIIPNEEVQKGFF